MLHKGSPAADLSLVCSITVKMLQQFFKNVRTSVVSSLLKKHSIHIETGSIDVTHSGLIAEKARKYGLSGHMGISAGGGE